MGCFVGIVYGQRPPPRLYLAYFSALWLGMVLLLAARLPAKLRAYRRFRIAAPETKTLAQAVSLFEAERRRRREND